MLLKRTERTKPGERRYDAATLNQVMELAYHRDTRRQETLSANQVQAIIGAGLGVDPRRDTPATAGQHASFEKLGRDHHDDACHQGYY